MSTSIGGSISVGESTTRIDDCRLKFRLPRGDDFVASSTELRRIVPGIPPALFVPVKGVDEMLNEREDRSMRLPPGVSVLILSVGTELVEQDRSSFRRFVDRLSMSSAACFARAAASYWA
jgi:hypothetical protein